MIRLMLNIFPLAGQSSGGSIDSSGSLLSLFQNLNSIGGGLGGAFSGAGAGAGSVVIYPGQGSSAYTGYNGYSGYTGYSSATVSPGGRLLCSCPPVHTEQNIMCDIAPAAGSGVLSQYGIQQPVVIQPQSYYGKAGIISTIFNAKLFKKTILKLNFSVEC